SGFGRDRRARLCADGERAPARRALQQMVFAPAADGGNAQSADESAACRDFQSPRRAGGDHSAGLSVVSTMRLGHQRKIRPYAVQMTRNMNTPANTTSVKKCPPPAMRSTPTALPKA